MRVTCIACLHGYKPVLPGGDLLIIAGDLTARDTREEFTLFNDWLMKQDYPKKIIIAGNHDGFLEKEQPSRRYFSVGCYLQDTMEEYEGLKIYGSPWTPTFYNWHFMKNRGEQLKAMWDKIPVDTDILVTHGPPFGILDQVKYSSRGIRQGDFKFAGCEELRNAVERIQPKLHVFGHIHESYGTTLLKCTPTDVLCVNACIMNEEYKPVNKPINLEYNATVKAFSLLP